MGPFFETSKFWNFIQNMWEWALVKNIDFRLNFNIYVLNPDIDAGHLCILPTIPMIHESFMIHGSKTITQWSYHVTPEAKIHESNECKKLYKNILKSLNKYFWDVPKLE